MYHLSSVKFAIISLVLWSTPIVFAQVTAIGFPVSAMPEQAGENRTIAEAEQAAISDVAVPETHPAFSDEAASRKYMPERLPEKENYVMSIELAHLSWPLQGERSSDRLGGRIAVGFNRPHYDIKDNLRVIGRFDLKFDGIIIGIQNSARFTFRYDLFRSFSGQKSGRFELVCDNIALKIGIPFGRR